MLETEIINLGKKIEMKRFWIPRTEAGGLVQFIQNHWWEYLLLASQVQNSVLSVNPNFGHLPFHLEVGKESPLGLFAQTSLKERLNSSSLPKGDHLLERWWSFHHRSALLGRVWIADNNGNLYRDIDFKGLGLVVNRPEERTQTGFLPGFLPGKLRLGGSEREGLLSEERAEHDFQTSEAFHNLGIRSHRVLALIALEEIIVSGRRCSLAETTSLGLLDEDFRPVVALRAFGTKARVMDVLGDGPKNDRAFPDLLLEDAIALVSQELNQTPHFPPEEYLLWFARTLGRNVGLMHKNGLSHHWLTPHNITLDCRIADLDTVLPLIKEKEQVGDIEKAQNTIGRFFDRVRILEGRPLSGISGSSLMGEFQEGYNTGYTSGV